MGNSNNEESFSNDYINEYFPVDNEFSFESDLQEFCRESTINSIQFDLNRYTFGLQHNNAGSAIVFNGEDVTLKYPVLIKHVQGLLVQNVLRFKKIVMELIIIDALRCENIVCLMDVGILRTDIYVVTELCSSNVHSLIYSPMYSNLTIDKVLSIMLQTISALAHIHSLNVAHCNIRPESILLDDHLTVKLTDFNYASIVTDLVAQDSEFLSSISSYRAPELLLCSKDIGTEQDLWGAGCVFAEMVARKPLFQGRSRLDLLRNIILVCHMLRIISLLYFLFSLPNKIGERFSDFWRPVVRNEFILQIFYLQGSL